MKHLIKEKLRSPSGASITFALLLFLVCAVIGAVVLVAGTAASGRVSQLAEMDQRYYSVMSAAELLAQEISEADEIEITRTREHFKKTTVSYRVYIDDDGVEQTSLIGTSDEYRTLYETSIVPFLSNPITKDTEWKDNEDASKISTPDKGDEISLTNADFLTKLAIYLMFGDSSPVYCNYEDAMDFSFSAGHQHSGNFDIELTPSSGINNEEASKLKVNCTYKLKSDGSIEFIIRSSDNKYAVKLTMSPEIAESESESESEEETQESTEVGYDEIKITTETKIKTAKIKWNIDGIEKYDRSSESSSNNEGGGSGG